MTGKILLQKIEELMAARPDVSKAEFGRAIHRGAPWYSEFFSGKRTTDSLRLVIAMAKFFGVQVGFLVNEKTARRDDAQTVSLLGIWADLDREQRDALLHIALRLRQLRGPSDRGRDQ